MENREGFYIFGSWKPQNAMPDQKSVVEHINNIRKPLYIIRNNKTGEIISAQDGAIDLLKDTTQQFQLIGILPPLYPEWLGDRSFQEVHNVRFNYIAGAMYRGITSSRMVISMAKAQMLAFFGAAGFTPDRVEKHIKEIADALAGSHYTFGSNLIYSPTEPELENAVVDIYLKYNVRKMSASAFMKITPAIVKYACKGLKISPNGKLVRRNCIFAKVSRPDMAELFMSPPPKDILNNLLTKGEITEEEAKLAMQLPIAEDITMEADSGGHTDNRPLVSILPATLVLRDRLVNQYKFRRRIRIGAAGGISTPMATAGAFAMGAAYVLSGTINEASVEAGISNIAKKMLAEAGIADVTMAPAGDMFEMGVKVQVLKRGTLFPGRASYLYKLYQQYNSLDDIPETERNKLKNEIFKKDINEVWEETRSFFMERNKKIVEKAEKEPKYKMALVFRWYLGLSGQWAIDGIEDRKSDFQIQCGPSMGAFNEWARGSYLEKVENRHVVDMALNLMEGAAVVTRASQLRDFGINVPSVAFNYRPKKIILE
jgi:PfaD family protein